MGMEGRLRGASEDSGERGKPSERNRIPKNTEKHPPIKMGKNQTKHLQLESFEMLATLYKFCNQTNKWS